MVTLFVTIDTRRKSEYMFCTIKKVVAKKGEDGGRDINCTRTRADWRNDDIFSAILFFVYVRSTGGGSSRLSPASPKEGAF